MEFLFVCLSAFPVYLLVIIYPFKLIKKGKNLTNKFCTSCDVVFHGVGYSREPVSILRLNLE